jgi:HK97 family phage prohead protease
MLHVVTGPPCGGKSTYVLERKAAGDAVVDFDAIATALGSSTPHASDGHVRLAALAARRAAIDTLLLNTEPESWIIHTWPTPAQLEQYAAAGADFVEVDPGLDVALARAAADERPDGTASAIQGWYDKREGKATMPNELLPGTRRIKSYQPTLFKAAGQDGLAEGQFEALASVFGNIDSYGDRIVKGAFAETLLAWKDRNDPIPVIWSHQWSDPAAHIGYVLEVEEREEGLWYRAQLDVADNPFAAQVYRLMKGRRVTQQSFGFDVVDAVDKKEDGQYVFEITKCDLFEVGPCLVGVNQATDLLDIKSRGAGSLAGVEQPSQATPPAADSRSNAPGSAPEESASSKGMSPASVQLLTEFYAQEGAHE